MKKIALKFNVVGSVAPYDIMQTVVIKDEDVSAEDLIRGLNNGSMVTTIGHNKADLKEDNYDTEIYDADFNRIGYVEKQDVEDGVEYCNFELVDN